MSRYRFRVSDAHRRVAVVVAALLLIGSQSLAAQRKRGKCRGEAPDSLWLAAGPVYLDCEVDRKASLRVNEPRISYTPSGGDRRCRQATLEFVVDPEGNPELATVRTQSTNDPELEAALKTVVSDLKYSPAKLDGAAVRQLVVYKRTVMTVVVVRIQGQSAGPPPRAPRPTC